MSNLKRYTLYLLNMVDLVSIIISHVLSYIFRVYVFHQLFPFVKVINYSEFLLAIVISYVVYNIVYLYNDEQYFQRQSLAEINNSLKMSLFVVGCTLGYFYISEKSSSFSRIYVLVFLVLLFCINAILRIVIRKLVIPLLKNSSITEEVLVVTDSLHAETVITELRNANDWRFSIKSFVIVDKDMKGKSINGIPVVSNKDEIFDDIQSEEIDAVLLSFNVKELIDVKSWIPLFQQAGKLVHVSIQEYEYSSDIKTLDQFGKSAIVTYRLISAMPKRKELFKRLLDSILALFILPLFLVVSIIVYVINSVDSKGPLLVSRVRVGKNNRRFYQYRFRVFKLDADEQNANGVLPYSSIGKILKKTHLDGFPMLLNILAGDMSFVGPKSPNLHRYLYMNAKQRGTLSICPGVIGYWSCIEDAGREFRMEQEYIGGWNIWKDINIIIRTVFLYLTGRSLRRDGDTHVQEEFDYVRQARINLAPYSFEKNYTADRSIGYYCYSIIKRLFDIILSFAGIILLCPLFILLSVLVTADDGGNPFYGHSRVGKDGKRIKVYKFRSMRMDAGDLEKLLSPEQLEQYKKEFKIDKDPRITKIGMFLRKTSLDELPQLFNILGGSLSIIGPRPIVEEELEKYGSNVAKLLSVKPGLTGYWQAYARNNAVYETGERQAMEMYYVEHQGLFLDCKIFLKTFGRVLSGDGAE